LADTFPDWFVDASPNPGKGFPDAKDPLDWPDGVLHLGALMIVASTIVPPLILMPLRRRRSLTLDNGVMGRLWRSNMWRSLHAAVPSSRASQSQ
jgi:hypothetical protein